MVPLHLKPRRCTTNPYSPRVPLPFKSKSLGGEGGRPDWGSSTYDPSTIRDLALRASKRSRYATRTDTSPRDYRVRHRVHPRTVETGGGTRPKPRPWPTRVSRRRAPVSSMGSRKARLRLIFVLFLPAAGKYQEITSDCALFSAAITLKSLLPSKP